MFSQYWLILYIHPKHLPIKRLSKRKTSIHWWMGEMKRQPDVTQSIASIFNKHQYKYEDYENNTSVRKKWKIASWDVEMEISQCISFPQIRFSVKVFVLIHLLLCRNNNQNRQNATWALACMLIDQLRRIGSSSSIFRSPMLTETKEHSYSSHDWKLFLRSIYKWKTNSNNNLLQSKA